MYTIFFYILDFKYISKAKLRKFTNTQHLCNFLPRFYKSVIFAYFLQAYIFLANLQF